MTRHGWLAALACLHLSVTCAAASGPCLTPEEAVSILHSLHEDFGRYIGEVRYGTSRLRPGSIYAGLVRPGGNDPRLADDGPRMGLRAVNDLIIYADTFDLSASVAWRRLILDHEYFHARHMAHGFALPVVGFGDVTADADYYEALAWGYVVRRAEAGVYGELSAREAAEALSRYRRHRSAFRTFVFDRQPSAWAHYGRFLPAHADGAADVTPARAAPTGEIEPRAAPVSD